MIEIRILNLRHKKSILVDIYRESLFGLPRGVVFCIRLGFFNSWDIVHDTQPGADPGMFLFGVRVIFDSDNTETFFAANY